jgi:hypothetical protein
VTEVSCICMNDRQSFDYGADLAIAWFWSALHSLCRTEHCKYCSDKSFRQVLLTKSPCTEFVFYRVVSVTLKEFIYTQREDKYMWIMASRCLSCRIPERIGITPSFTRPLLASGVRTPRYIRQMTTLKHHLVTFRSISCSSATPVCLSNSVLITALPFVI